MTQPNRLATLAVSLPAALGPRRYVYAAPNFLNVNFENGEWYMRPGKHPVSTSSPGVHDAAGGRYQHRLDRLPGGVTRPDGDCARKPSIHIRPVGIPDLRRGFACWILPPTTTNFW